MPDPEPRTCPACGQAHPATYFTFMGLRAATCPNLPLGEAQVVAKGEEETS